MDEQKPSVASTTGNSSDHSDSNSGGAKHISAQEEADLSSALIAKLLAEEGGGGSYANYYSDYGNGAFYGGMAADDHISGSEADDDWDPSVKKRRASSKVGKVRKHLPNNTSIHTGRGAESSDSDASDSASHKKSKRAKKARAAGPKKEKPPPLPVVPGQYRSGAYTENEEQLFYKGLELFGRSWSEISEYVGTRDPKSIRSHAQKYFIKLFRDNIPLPAKVCESGEGYTLSGRPLDPNSAAARPYLQHVMQLDPAPGKLKKTTQLEDHFEPISVCDGNSSSINAENSHVSERDPMPSSSISNEHDTSVKDVLDVTSTESAEFSIPALDAKNNDSDKSGEQVGNKDASTIQTPSGATKDADQHIQQSSQSSVMPKSPVRTEYAMSRPQRNHTRPAALRYDDPHQMVRCTPFTGSPLSDIPGSQPFRVVVHTNAQMQMDFHAHLMLSEVIGLLGGLWDADKKVLTVIRAFPCTALETDDAHTNVEMDPGSELVVRHQIMSAGLRVVGWYHSHPTFRPDPSIIDIENQTAYQALFRDSESSEEPFVGAIVGPYDAELPGPISVLNWFYVGRAGVDRGHPKRLMVETEPDKSLSLEEQEILLNLLDSARSLKHHAALEEAWRPSSTELRSLKMAVSLAHRMPWLLQPDDSSSVSLPASSSSTSDDGINLQVILKEAFATEITAFADTENSSECTANEHAADLVSIASDANDDGGYASIDKRIPQAHLLAGQRAVQDPFIVAVCSRFSVGIFKGSSDSKITNSQALVRVFAAYFMQWAC
ncbi:hypothetical protein GGI25_003777 [Coemansia spiralis]|uniref:Myb-like, SWIRM and MPN domain-containing protein 1 n=2 Tax=Coemansia TaxID=4863 RepID=A0A9W8KW65_9FUNG|nr:hypothetical protein EDC05_001577 [Coemansia umbellata]KAJ2624313.1 hypothetical protein GGI26_001669 [Coemansia sp. RSA 1358]KAJ2675940.1 hypothetical protein GGI25_003777 [Coemansia spiralis]